MASVTQTTVENWQITAFCS